jgi:hypothetical protein
VHAHRRTVFDAGPPTSPRGAKIGARPGLASIGSIVLVNATDRVACLLLAAIASSLGCDHPAASAPAGDAGLPAPVATVLSAPGVPPVASAQAIAALPVELPPTLRHFFAGYRDGTDFDFMRADCRPVMTRFVTLSSVDVATAIREAKSFFRDKRHLEYRPDTKHLRIAPGTGDGGAGVTVNLPLTMAWAYPIPKGWGSDWPAFGEEPAISRAVTVDLEIELDPDGRIARYVEARVESPLLRVTGAEECNDPDRGDQSPVPALNLKKGTLVHDLGETVVVGTNAKGTDVARKVRVNGRDGWTMDRVAFAVANPSGGTSAGAASCLDPVGDAGAP